MSQATIICPACKGSKVDSVTEGRCLWCNGARVVGSQTALAFADTLRRRAFDAAISGFHTVDDGEEMASKAAAIRETAERV